MSNAPYRIRKLAEYYESQDGVNLGIVGDSRHTTGYHLGKDRLQPGDYSIRTPRDKDGLTKAASAIDLGKVPGLPKLRKLSRWLVEECRSGAADCADIREIVYSPDGAIVLRWDRERGQKSEPVREGDDSHLTHTHVSWYRDAQSRDKIAPFRRFFEPVPPPPPPLPCVDELPIVQADLVATQATLADALDRLARISDIAEGD